MIADKILKFYKTLDLTSPLPDGIEAMNPYQDAVAFEYCKTFYKKFYNDNRKRKIILGINPGRFGGGITGIPFTDPVKLEQCGISNPFKKKTELSADFIYAVINAYGGPASFYGDFFISALSPLGFIKDGKNLNYYDSKPLLQVVEPFIVKCIKTTLTFGFDSEVCFCLGEGENYRYLEQLNEKHRFFRSIIPLPHPRFIMQYKRKKLQEYIQRYITQLSSHPMPNLV